MDVATCLNSLLIHRIICLLHCVWKHLTSIYISAQDVLHYFLVISVLLTLGFLNIIILCFCIYVMSIFRKGLVMSIYLTLAEHRCEVSHICITHSCFLWEAGSSKCYSLLPFPFFIVPVPLLFIFTRSFKARNALTSVLSSIAGVHCPSVLKCSFAGFITSMEIKVKLVYTKAFI